MEHWIRYWLWCLVYGMAFGVAVSTHSLFAYAIEIVTFFTVVLMWGVAKEGVISR